MAIIVVWLTELRELLSYLGITLLLSTALTIASLFVLVRKKPEAAMGLSTYPWAPLSYIGFTLLFIGIAATRNPWEVVAAILTILSGVVVYFVFTRKRT